MDSHRDEYTINPETVRKIKLGTQIWKRLAAKYYMIDGKFIRSDHSWFTSVFVKQGMGCEYEVNEGSKETETHNSS